MAHGLKDAGNKEPVARGLIEIKEGKRAKEQEKEIDKICEKAKRKGIFSFLF